MKKQENKIRIAVLMGGPSSEHEVSLNSGKIVIASMSERYHAMPVILPKAGKVNLKKQLPSDVHLVFLALHGEWGEDGQVQKILEKMGLPYTGSDSKASILAINKFATGRLAKKSGLIMPEHFLIDNKNWRKKINLINKFPCVVKPNKSGSSVGVLIVQGKTELNNALKNAFKFDKEVLIEDYIDGIELTCGILDNGKGSTKALIPTQIVPNKSNFFDYSSKYEAGGAREITPPDLDAKIVKEVQRLAVKAHKIVGASGVSRSDFILSSSDGKLYFLEINTIPGMTETSLLPQGAAAAGLSFPKLLDKIVKAALNRFNKPE